MFHSNPTPDQSKQPYTNNILHTPSYATENCSFIIGPVNVHCKMLFTFVIWRRLSLLLVGGQILSMHEGFLKYKLEVTAGIKADIGYLSFLKIGVSTQSKKKIDIYISDRGNKSEVGMETCRVNPASLFFSAPKETVQNLNWSESPEVTLLTEWTVKSVQAKNTTIKSLGVFIFLWQPRHADRRSPTVEAPPAAFVCL